MVRKNGQNSRKIKELQIFRPTPKPWVAGSNPPAPAITEAKWLRFFSFWCVLFCISLSKAEMTSVFNSFISKNSFSFSVVSVCSNRSVWYSIKKAATVSTQLQKTSGLPQILIVAVALLSLFTPTQFLMRYRQKSLVIPLSIDVSFLT